MFLLELGACESHPVPFFVDNLPSMTFQGAYANCTKRHTSLSDTVITKVQHRLSAHNISTTVICKCHSILLHYVSQQSKNESPLSKGSIMVHHHQVAYDILLGLLLQL